MPEKISVIMRYISVIACVKSVNRLQCITDLSYVDVIMSRAADGSLG